MFKHSSVNLQESAKCMNKMFLYTQQVFNIKEEKIYSYISKHIKNYA